MDGERIQNYWSDEVDALVKTYRQFEKLIPSERVDGAAHAGEDGRYIEDLVREYLQKFLPRDLEVLTGFILRPAVKTGETGQERKNDQDKHSRQLDVIVFNSAAYPVFQRFGNSVIVPPEGVIAIVSIKKHLNDGDVFSECSKLFDAASLCQTLRSNNRDEKVRGPFLALVSVKSKIDKKTTDNLDWIFQKAQEAYASKTGVSFDQLIGYIGALDKWSIFKRRPKTQVQAAEYVGFNHQEGESHLGLQFLLTGILSVYYDDSRRALRRPGFTAFPSGRPLDKKLGEIPCTNLR